jgi:Spy/CpxP family protein refolding chaperone
MKRWSVALTAVVLAVGVSACGRHRGHDPEKMNQVATARLEDALDDLDATDAQRRELLALKDQLFAQGKVAFAENRQTRDAFLAALESPSPDAARLHALVDTRAEAMRAFAHQAVDAAVKAHQTLTPEQRAQVAKKVRRHAR